MTELTYEEVRPEQGREVIKRSYGWALDKWGRVNGLVAGDMGYEPTHIRLSIGHIVSTADALRENPINGLQDDGVDLDELLKHEELDELRALLLEARNQLGCHRCGMTGRDIDLRQRIDAALTRP